MIVSPFARQHSGVAYREEVTDRGDDVGGGGGEDEAAKAAAATSVKEAETKAAAEKEATEKAEREKALTIPKSRFDEAVGKERARAEKAEKEIAERNAKEAERNKGETLDKLRKELDELEDKLEAKMTEGTPEERKALRTQIRAKSEELSDAKTSQAEGRARAHAVEQVRYDNLVEKVETEYPFLVPDTEGYNEAMARDILEMKAGFEHAGMSSTAALTRTLQLLKPALDAAKPKPKEEKKEPEGETPEQKKAKAEETAKATAAEAKRREEAVKKGLEAAAAQPGKPAAAQGKEGAPGAVDVKKMSQKDFDKLPEDELARLRGDFV